MIDESQDIFKRHLNVSALQQDIDWYKINTDQFNVETDFNMHRCKQEDFGDDELAKKFFASWTGYMILCTDEVTSDGKFLQLNGAKGMMRTSSIVFRVEKCAKFFENKF